MTSLKRSVPIDGKGQNLSDKVYVRATRSGKVQKIVREVYLRRDVPCSSKLCHVCLNSVPKDASGNSVPFVLSATPARTNRFPEGHYLVPDTNIFLSAMDVFEISSAFFDVIVLQTVLEEVRNRSLPSYHRLLELIRNQEKRFYVFFNDFRQETHVERMRSETINDRNDRAIRAASSWYAEHLEQAVGPRSRRPAIVTLTDDHDNLNQILSSGGKALSLKDYVSDLEEAVVLLDMVSQLKTSHEEPVELLYPDHYSQSRVQTGLNDGTLYQGTFGVSPYNYLEGSVKVASFDRPLLVIGRENSNRAIAGDMVVVELLPKRQWKSPSTTIVEEDNVKNDENPEIDGNEAIVSRQEKQELRAEVRRQHGKDRDGHSQPTARIVSISKRNWRQYVGHIDKDSVKTSSRYSRTQQMVSLIPMDKRIPKIRIRTRLARELTGKRIVVAIDSWNRDTRFPLGHFVKSLGDIEAKGAETEALLMEFDVQYRPFPKAVLDCLPAEGHDWKVPVDLQDPAWMNRKDLRDLLVCSIDPQGCVDIDDALHARKLANGNFEVGVHIADVSNFVRPSNAMDTEAAARGTTVYLVDKRIDMLPMLLGTDLCSLKPYVERFAFSVLWELSSDADIVRVEFTKSVIRSREAFSYEAAQHRINDQQCQDELTQSIRNLLMLSKKLKRTRMEAGALNLASPEVRVETDSETSDPIDVKTKRLLDTNSLVEEFMLLANISVARRVYQSFPQTALLRRHAAPPKTNFDELAKQLRTKKGMELRADSSKTIADSLDACVDPENPFFNTLVRIMATRCMMSAEYFPAGIQPEPEFRHYGLASDIYTHFTSPIRRYADLVVHRQLAAAIGYEKADPSIYSCSKLEPVCRNINVRHRNAQMAGRASVDYYVGQALKGKVTGEDAYVMRVFSNGFVVFVPRFGIEGLIRVRDMAAPEPIPHFDTENYSLQINDPKETIIELFQKIRVSVSDETEESTGKRKVKIGLV